MAIKQRLNKIYKYYGKDKQMLQAIEEMQELGIELIKSINRGKDNAALIANELADVQNMLVQVQIAYNISNKELQTLMESKVDRQLKRIDNGK